MWRWEDDPRQLPGPEDPAAFWRGLGWAALGSLMFWAPVAAGLWWGVLR